MIQSNNDFWILPSFELLDDPKANLKKKNKEILAKEKQEIIQTLLKAQGVKTELSDVNIGPTFTRYCFKISPDLKIESVTKALPSIKTGLGSQQLTLETVVADKPFTIAFELKNDKREVVMLKNVLMNQKFLKPKNHLTIPLGKQVMGTILFTSLAEAPHMLVAGTTGSGKSIWLNSAIISLLYTYTPDDLQFIMVDPKRVELTVYKGIPHLLTPVVTDLTQIPVILDWIIKEVDRRNEILEKAKKRNIAEYNNSNPSNRLARIILIVDELAQITASGNKKFDSICENALAKIGAMARSAGIHMILATQRPDMNVISGLIKANVPARVCFQVLDGINSTVILDRLGAENLLGKGDGLFELDRFQSPFIDTEEVMRVVDHWIDQNNIEEIKEPIQKIIKEKTLSEDTKLALRYAIENNGISTTRLQKVFKWSYVKANKIVLELEGYEVIGPKNGQKLRLVFADDYEEIVKHIENKLNNAIIEL